MWTKLQRFLPQLIKRLQHSADRFWYAPFIGALAAIDNIILIIPNDGILISSAMLNPKRWFLFAFTITIGSTLGALALGALVEWEGLPFILNLYPGIDESFFWIKTNEFFQQYGLLVVFIIALMPIVQQPAVILAALASTPLLELALVVFLGRSIKFLIMAYVASHAPKLLARMWGVQEELKEVGLEIPGEKEPR